MKTYIFSCVVYYVRHPVVVGGEGCTIEIDETVLTHRKYHKGVLEARQQWFFGGVERGSGLCFLVPIEKRDSATLLPIIQHHIRPGSTIISDCWAAYNGIEKLPEMYQHYTVNHSDKEHPFVGQETGAYTNTIESTWQKFKARHKEEYGTARTLFGTYIAQFLWRRQFAGKDCMYNLWSQISDVYNLSDK